MNTLASLKSKLMVKPHIEQREQIAVFVNEPSIPKESVKILEEGEKEEKGEKKEKIEKEKKEKELILIDERDKGYNIEKLMSRLSNSNILAVKQKLDIKQKMPEEVVKPIISEDIPPSKKAKVITFL